MKICEAIPGIILAGGQSRRMGGGDKGLLVLGGRAILARIIERASPQTAGLALSANGDPARYQSFGLPVIPDSVPGFAGPLAGILAGLDWVLSTYPDATHMASFPSDAPFFPRDLVSRLARATQEQDLPIACAASGGRFHPVFALWPVTLRAALHHALVEENQRKVESFMTAQGVARAEFPADPSDPFFNINCPEDLAVAEKLADLAS